ncbi:hypothetical protein [Methylocella sp.]|jgi:hypothetical protein|uniref:hypothetical protein n=1 Tax=Methylocella sp. TaxID=1978226 RepID=UPI003C140A1D
MGKAAYNERIKLRAMFYNNLSVGSLIAGFLVPSLIAVPAFPPLLDDFMNGKLSSLDLHKPAAFVITLGLALWAALWLRNEADWIITKIQD